MRHPEGTAAPAAFPAAIRPDRPVRDIAGLRHRVGPVAAALAFGGDVFATEDRRNGSDASFRTLPPGRAAPAPGAARRRSGPGADRGPTGGRDDLARIAAPGCPVDAATSPRGAGPGAPAPPMRPAGPRAPVPGARIGAGMLSNLTELNRCRPGPGLGAYVTHGNAAIVHMADDRSVAQTLEALPDIFARARAIGGPRGCRPGLCAVAMRGNPYGAGLAANPEARRMTMTDRDPRQETAFAAACALGVAVLAAQAGAEAVALAAPGGPFGRDGPQGPRPIRAMVAALAGLAGRTAETSPEAGRATQHGAFAILDADAQFAHYCQRPERRADPRERHSGHGAAPPFASSGPRSRATARWPG